MTNGARGEVTLTLGGETYVLRPEFGVVAKIEEALAAAVGEEGVATVLVPLALFLRA